MKIKIEADLNVGEKQTLKMISQAILQKEVAELMKAFPPGEHFKMERPEGSITITKGGDPEPVRTCRVCGCTDDDCRQCIEKTGMPCHWVASDLCSACL